MRVSRCVYILYRYVCIYHIIYIYIYIYIYMSLPEGLKAVLLFELVELVHELDGADELEHPNELNMCVYIYIYILARVGERGQSIC